MEIITQIHKMFIEFLLTLQKYETCIVVGCFRPLYVSEISRTC